MKMSLCDKLLLSVAFAVPLFSLGCEKSIPITVAAVGNIDMQADPKDKTFEFGLTLAKEDIKLEGGINGAEIEIVYIGDEQNQNSIKDSDDKAIKMGSMALISNRENTLSLNSLPTINEKKVLMIGTAEQGSGLSKKDDFFLTLQPSEKLLAEELAVFAVQKLKLTQIGLVLQEKLNPLNKPFLDAFNAKTQSLGADNELLYTYETLDLESARQNLGSYEAEEGRGVLIVAEPRHTKIFARLSRQTITKDIPVLAAPWGIAKDPDENLNGVFFPMSFDPDSKAALYEIFRRNYQRRFGVRVDHNAVNAYDSLMIIAEALRESGRDSELLRQTVLQKGEFDGLQGLIKFDKNGDCVRPIHILTIKDKFPRKFEGLN